MTVSSDENPGGTSHWTYNRLRVSLVQPSISGPARQSGERMGRRPILPRFCWRRRTILARQSSMLWASHICHPPRHDGRCRCRESSAAISVSMTVRSGFTPTSSIFSSGQAQICGPLSGFHRRGSSRTPACSAPFRPTGSTASNSILPKATSFGSFQ